MKTMYKDSQAYGSEGTNISLCDLPHRDRDGDWQACWGCTAGAKT